MQSHLWNAIKIVNTYTPLIGFLKELLLLFDHYYKALHKMNPLRDIRGNAACPQYSS